MSERPDISTGPTQVKGKTSPVNSLNPTPFGWCNRVISRGNNSGKRASDNWVPALKVFVQMVIGSLIAVDILMIVDIMAPDRSIALWWLFFLFSGSVAAEIIDLLGKFEHERPKDWPGYGQLLCGRSGRIMWRWAHWTLIAGAALLFADISGQQSGKLTFPVMGFIDAAKSWCFFTLILLTVTAGCLGFIPQVHRWINRRGMSRWRWWGWALGVGLPCASALALATLWSQST